MIFLFLLTLFLYAIFLVLYRPSPSSLKAKPITLRQNFWSIKAAFFTGILLIVIFFITSNFNFMTINQELYLKLGLHNEKISLASLPLQLFSHSFIHLDIIHLISNVSGIGIASAYERRVGHKRFLTVLTIGCFSSIPSILFYSEPTVICGISGGVYGLAAAYFLDHEGFELKEWIHSLMGFACLLGVLSLSAEFADKAMLSHKIDHIGHVLGALGVITFCRICERRTS
jgi:membrane associated rhomboid family serine protease